MPIAAARLAALVESSQDAIVSATLDGLVDGWNAAAERMFGYGADEILGRPVALLSPDEDRATVAGMLRVLSAGGRVPPFDAVRMRRDGRPVQVQISLSPVPDPSGRVIGVSAIIRDMTEQRELRAMSEFLSSASERLARSLDVDVTIRELASLAIERIADGCLVTLRDADAEARGAYPFVNVAVASRHAETARMVEENERLYPLPADAPSGYPRAIRTGLPELVPDGAFEHDVLPHVAVNADHLARLRRLDMQSAMIVPLVARGDTFGAITLVRHGPGRRVPFTARDLAFAEDLGRRAGAAIDNARLYAAELRARLTAQHSDALLDAAERRRRAIVDSMNDAMVEYDRGWRIIYLNERARTVLHQSGGHADPIGGVLWDLYPGLRDTPLQRGMQDAMTRRLATTIEWQSDKRTWQEVRTYPTADGLVVYWADVTARHRARERTELLADVGAAFAERTDIDDALVALVHLVARRLVDYAAVYLVEDGALRLVETAHRDPARAAAARETELRYPPDPEGMVGAPLVVRTGRSELHRDLTPGYVRLFARDEDHLDRLHEMGMVSAMTVPLVASGRMLGALSLVTTTPQRQFDDEDLAFAEELARRAALAVDNARLLQEAEGARARAEEASRAKSEFLATMSHELRTPLNAIRGHIGLLELGLHGPVAPAQQEALTRVNRAQERLLGLINDVLNVARLESGEVAYDLQPTDVIEVVQEATSLLAPEIAARGIRLEIESSDATPDDGVGGGSQVLADREKVGQILLNLLSNAMKFTPSGGSIRVTFEVTEAAGLLRVRDSGVGIPADKLEAVFEPFVQLGRSFAGTASGTGLGLSISRGLARAMGGELVARSEAGCGAELVLRLPLAAVAAPGSPRSPGDFGMGGQDAG